MYRIYKEFYENLEKIYSNQYDGQSISSNDSDKSKNEHQQINTIIDNIKNDSHSNEFISPIASDSANDELENIELSELKQK